MRTRSACPVENEVSMKTALPLVTLSALLFAGAAWPQPKVIREVKLEDGRKIVHACRGRGEVRGRQEVRRSSALAPEGRQFDPTATPWDQIPAVASRSPGRGERSGITYRLLSPLPGLRVGFTACSPHG